MQRQGGAVRVAQACVCVATWQQNFARCSSVPAPGCSDVFATFSLEQKQSAENCFSEASAGSRPGPLGPSCGPACGASPRQRGPAGSQPLHPRSSLLSAPVCGRGRREQVLRCRASCCYGDRPPVAHWGGGRLRRASALEPPGPAVYLGGRRRETPRSPGSPGCALPTPCPPLTSGVPTASG